MSLFNVGPTSPPAPRNVVSPCRACWRQHCSASPPRTLQFHSTLSTLSQNTTLALTPHPCGLVGSRSRQDWPRTCGQSSAPTDGCHFPYRTNSASAPIPGHEARVGPLPRQCRPQYSGAGVCRPVDPARNAATGAVAGLDIGLPMLVSLSNQHCSCRRRTAANDLMQSKNIRAVEFSAT